MCDQVAIGSSCATMAFGPCDGYDFLPLPSRRAGTLYRMGSLKTLVTPFNSHLLLLPLHALSLHMAHTPSDSSTSTGAPPHMLVQNIALMVMHTQARFILFIARQMAPNMLQTLWLCWEYYAVLIMAITARAPTGNKYRFHSKVTRLLMLMV